MRLTHHENKHLNLKNKLQNNELKTTCSDQQQNTETLPMEIALSFLLTFKMCLSIKGVPKPY